ncbi:hypothetical protein UB33_06610 [Photobacterium angustum]|uniref:DUF2913 family protein n=1 Tax=Photobacterium angustum TaxID=661 RepID=UPI0005E7FA51|nr:DUF2913 family protein [Photobacterium angustum]KJF95954.1 hypothetical protein UB39_03400 [Photobacterium angustum]KJG06927.1 hypothetical protein UB33_06610 [Photobacterium angustum]PSV95021.1 DUF2913 domain-containing protein [Photobacterium angustum]PSW80093.1 DUF2913 domain-containing protein [Photobacterium angustum]
MNQSELLLDVSTHALLHLEFKKLDKRLSLAEKNNILVQYLKPIVKSHQYRLVKKTTKSWLQMGRKLNTDFEATLNQERERLQQMSSTDLYQFIALIQEIERELNTKAQYSLAHAIDLNARYGKVLICVVDEDLTSSFDEDGLMTKATQILFIGNEQLKDQFSAIVDKSTGFQSVIAYEDENHLRIELFRL